MDPILAHFVAILGQFGVKNTFFSKKLLQDIFWVPRWSVTLKNPHFGPVEPQWTHLGVLRHFRSPCTPLGLAH